MRLLINSFIVITTVLVSLNLEATTPKANQKHRLGDSAKFWQLNQTPQQTNLQIYLSKNAQQPLVSYDISQCRFCQGKDDNCNMDGIFPIIYGSYRRKTAMGLICHVGVHSQRFAIYDDEKQLFERYGNFFIDAYPTLNGVTLRYDDPVTNELTTEHWPEKDLFKIGTAFPTQQLIPNNKLSTNQQAIHQQLTTIIAQKKWQALQNKFSVTVQQKCVGKGKSKTIKQSRLWRELATIASSFPKVKSKYSPLLNYPFYVNTLNIDKQLYSTFFTQTNTPLLAGPSKSSAVIENLNHQLIKIVPLSAKEPYNTNQWHFVHTSELGYGYVAAATVQPIINWQLTVKEMTKGWKITKLGFCDKN